MGSVFLTFKAFIFSLLTVLFLQISVGGVTLETYFLKWLRHSQTLEPLKGFCFDSKMKLGKEIDEKKQEISDMVKGFTDEKKKLLRDEIEKQLKGFK